MKLLLIGLITDDAGKISSSRAVMLMGIGIVLTGWLVVSIHKGELQNIPDNVLWLCCALLGAKTLQKCGEQKAPPTPPPPANPPSK